jgi:hypothetical protein
MVQKAMEQGALLSWHIGNNSHRVHLTPHIASLRREIVTPEVPLPIKNALVAEILSRWQARGTPHQP